MRKHSLVPNSRLVIDWPYETADIITEVNGKLLFYLLEKPYITKTDLPTASNTTIVCDSRALDRLVNPYHYRVLFCIDMFKMLTSLPKIGVSSLLCRCSRLWHLNPEAIR